MIDIAKLANLVAAVDMPAEERRALIHMIPKIPLKYVGSLMRILRGQQADTRKLRTKYLAKAQKVVDASKASALRAKIKPAVA